MAPHGPLYIRVQHSLPWCISDPSSPLPGAHSVLALLDCIMRTLLPQPSSPPPTPPTPFAWLAPSSPPPGITLGITFLRLPSLGHVSLLDAPIQIL